jgi:phosphoserine phosphatase
MSRLLFIDLDGTLVRTDMLVESAVSATRRNPLVLVRAPFWLLRGKARLKAELAARARIDVRQLPFNGDVIDLATARAAAGHEVVLATAADRTLAEAIAATLGVFRAVLASDGQRNLLGRRKLEAMCVYAQGRRFGYAGNGRADLPIWAEADEVIVVSPERGVAEGLERLGIAPDLTLPGQSSPFAALTWRFQRR